MFKDTWFLQLLEAIIILLVLSLPPWIALISKMKKRKTKKQQKILIGAFFIYILISIFTNNIMPTIITIIYITYTYIVRNKSEEAYFLRPLEKKVYKIKRKRKEYVITFSSDRLKITIQAIIFRIIVFVITFWYIVFLTSKGIPIKDQDIISDFLNASFLKSVYLGIIIIVTGPILEEFIFRHLFYRKLKSKTNSIVSAFITTIIFTLFHYNIGGIIAFFALGTYNCYLYDRYGYRAAVLNHGIFNLISLLCMVFMNNVI